MLLRSFRSMTALAWGLPLRLPKRPLHATLLFLALTFGCVLALVAVGPIREHLGAPVDWLAIVGSLAAVPLYFFGVGVSALQLFNSLLLFPWNARKEETYGVLGVAAGLLFSFFVLGRIVVLSGALNAVLAERRAGPAPRTASQ